jgi:hypothetical protein
VTDLHLPEPSSLDVVRTELDLERAIQDRRSESADSRAGIVLGFAGVVAGVALGSKSLLAIPGLIAAGVAAILAARVVWPQPQSTIDPRVLRLTYLAAPSSATALSVLDTRLKDYEFNQDQIKLKIKRLKTAIAALTVSVIMVLTVAAFRLVADAVDPPQSTIKPSMEQK